MKSNTIILAFGLGFLTAAAFHLVPGVSGQGKNSGGMNPLESRLKMLEQRANELKKQNVTQPSKTVVAPFEVTDSLGRRIFLVNDDGAKVFHGDNGFVRMGGNKDGGQIVATSSSGDYSWWLETAYGKPGFSMFEKNDPRIQLGKGVERGNYRLGFISGTNQNIAGIGENPTTHAGLILIFDKTGNLRDRMAVSENGKGLIDVLGLNTLPLTQLTEGTNKGGYLLICSANGCDPPMVEAGDAGGYGIVRVGPHMFQRGVTLLDLPGSAIDGKSQ
jgi:hypothetical protein